MEGSGDGIEGLEAGVCYAVIPAREIQPGGIRRGVLVGKYCPEML